MGEEPLSWRSVKGQFQAVPSRVKWIIYFSAPSTISYGYLIIAITAYLPELGVTGTEVGILLGVNGISFAVSAIPIGLLADRRGRKTIFLLGLFTIPPMILIYALTTEMLYLTIASTVAGVAEGAFMATWNALIADQTDVSNRSAAFSLSFILGNAGFGVGMALPVLFPPIESLTGLSSTDVHTGAFYGAALLALASPIAMMPLLRDYKEEIRPRSELHPTSLRASRTLLYKFSAINSLIGLGAGFIIPLSRTGS